MYTVIVDFENNHLPPVRLKRIRHGHTLLDVLLNKGVALRHDCGGICHCTTCRIRVNEGAEYVEPKSIRERDFLAKAGNADASTRLACQCVLLEGKGRVAICVPKLPDKNS